MDFAPFTAASNVMASHRRLYTTHVAHTHTQTQPQPLSGPPQPPPAVLFRQCQQPDAGDFASLKVWVGWSVNAASANSTHAQCVLTNEPNIVQRNARIQHIHTQHSILFNTQNQNQQHAGSHPQYILVYTNIHTEIPEQGIIEIN